MPLWMSLPALVLLGISSWISTLDPTGASGESLLLWSATATASWLVVTRLMRFA